MPVPRLEMQGVSKRFGATVALDNVSLSLQPGEIHALIGENGAGKSTLMKVLSGACSPDGGTLKIDGEPSIPADPLSARSLGIAMIYQELNLAPDLTAEENILLGEEPRRGGFIRGRELRDRAKNALETLNSAHLPLQVPVRTLTIAEQQIIEIARSLISEPRVLIMDEPTSSLTRVDIRNLFDVIRKLATRDVSIIYISHYLEECQELCQNYTVLRDGRSVGNGSMADMDVDSIVRMMVGREISDIYARSERQPGETVLQLKGLSGRKKPEEVTLDLKAGQVLGLAGIVGSGRTETLRVLFGLDERKAGTVAVFSQEDTRTSPRERLDQNVGLLSENRKEEGLLLNRSLADNFTLTRLAPLSRKGFISDRKQAKAASDLMETLEVKAAGPEQAISELSGGNQQKIAIGRLLHHEADIFLLDEPTRGIDVGSKAHIYKLINELASRGKAVIFVSSYLPELLGICDTVGVMCRGRLEAVRPVSEWTEHEVMAVSIGQVTESN